jgi:hypothetical protein
MDKQDNPKVVPPPAKKPKLSYKFLRPAAESETEIATQRGLLRREASGAYARMGYSMKAADLVRMAFSYFSRIEPIIGKDVQRRLIDIDKELAKIDEEEIRLEKREKSPKVVEELATLHKKAAKFNKLVTSLKDELKADQDEFISIMDQFQKFSSKLEEVKAKNIELTRDMEDEVTEIFREHRKVRFAKKKKKEVEKPEITVTEQEIVAAAIDEIKDAEKSKVVRKDDEVPPGYKPVR